MAMDKANSGLLTWRKTKVSAVNFELIRNRIVRNTRVSCHELTQLEEITLKIPRQSAVTRRVSRVATYHHQQSKSSVDIRVL